VYKRQFLSIAKSMSARTIGNALQNDCLNLVA
jgi:hypothetical protein